MARRRLWSVAARLTAETEHGGGTSRQLAALHASFGVVIVGDFVAVGVIVAEPCDVAGGKQASRRDRRGDRWRNRAGEACVVQPETNGTT